MTPLLVARDLRRSFGRDATLVEVLRGVSLALAPGEIVALMGPSGSGKSTLLAILGGLLAPSAGEVELAGQPLSAAEPERRTALRLAHVGFVFQTGNLFTSLSAVDNVRLALSLHGLRGREAARAATVLLEEVGLTGRLRAYPGTLSGGEQQRVAVARALAGDPSVILADEPTASLDWAHGREILALIRGRARARDAAALIVTHDPRVLEFADRTIRIEDGILLPEEDRHD